MQRPSFALPDRTRHAVASFYAVWLVAALSGGALAAQSAGVKTPSTPLRIVVIEFPDADTARRWYRSEEYQSALKIRQSASRGRVFLVEGAT